MKNLIVIMFITFFACMLNGCALSEGDYSVDKRVMDTTDLTFVGVPGLFAVQGSSVPVTNDLSLTALHVAELMPWRIVAVHGRCDLALIENNNIGKVFPKLESVKRGDVISTNGYSGRTYLPVRGVGPVVGKVKDNRSSYSTCLMQTSTAGAVQGMSGGAVLSKNGGLAGVLVGIHYKPSRAFFIPSSTIKPWLDENIAKYETSHTKT